MIPDKTPVFAIQKEHVVYWKSREYSIYIAGKRLYFLCKRVFDIVFSAACTFFLLSWLVPLVAITIKIDSAGPVFFSQRRVGKGGRTFSCFKFRSMFVNDEADKKQAASNDMRITRVGRWLRKTNLDEFPQFLNVFKGDMSIVGPRPHMQRDCQLFASYIPGYDFRCLVRPGMTGLAQVKGFSGPAEDPWSIFGRYQWDAFYVRNAGFGLDMRIIRQTLRLQWTCFIALFSFLPHTHH
ncbi:MAG TPA: sugar transferase [Puia sp.]|nr:sugar transferase [Puia sp.]